MSDAVISVENLGKSYLVGHNAAGSERYTAMRDVVARNTRNLVRKTRDMLQGRAIVQGDEVEEFWALKDVSFEIKRGDRVGIIGRKGAGKSTLLKILSRITEPTVGRIRIAGRVASLLEVGTGFHPELTGRENIYLNGAILGMSRKEIQFKFDQIVQFAEVERFLDTPVKRYSSGMYVRLAFAVAAHLESEILVVDEVLAVGDAQFQKKCLGKMSDVAQDGRTVLFVSHNMAAVQQLCQKGLVLKNGQVSFKGDIAQSVHHYHQGVEAVKTINLLERRDRQGSQWLKFSGVGLFDADGNEQSQAFSGQELFIRFYYVSDRMMDDVAVNIAFNIRTSQGYLLANLNSVDVGMSETNLHRTGFFQCTWPRFNLRSGSYDCALFCEVNGEIVDWMQSAFSIQVEEGNFFGTGKIVSRDAGDILVPHTWSNHSSC